MQATAVEGMESSIATDYIMKVPKLYPPSNQNYPIQFLYTWLKLVVVVVVVVVSAGLKSFV
jgi:hypothetical protein